MSAQSNQDDNIALPQLSDEAVVQILDFIEQMHALFESRYAAQILRFHDGAREDRIIHKSGRPTNGELF